MPRKKKISAVLTELDASSIWKSNPETVKKFLDLRPDYEQLCVEVAYILEKRIKEKEVEIAIVSQRAKTLNSFLEKIQRKEYQKPFEEIADFAGVRIVCLYVTDLLNIGEIIETEFDIHEKIDKFSEKDPNEFGYGAIHYIVGLGGKSVGARYDDLRKLKCEIQVRTVLQDAWAIIDHHLVYKRESDIPSHIQRRLNSLSGMFETADDQFESIRREREKYVSGLKRLANDQPAFLSTEINHDSFVSFLKWLYPDVKPKSFREQIQLVYEDIDKEKYKTLQDLYSAVKLAIPLLHKTITELKKPSIARPFTDERDSAAIRFAILMALVDSDYRKGRKFPPYWRPTIQKLEKRHLAKTKKKKS